MYERTIKLKCPVCNATSKDIPKNMGDQEYQCENCGASLRYKYKTKTAEEIRNPVRNSSSGMTFY